MALGAYDDIAYGLKVIIRLVGPEDFKLDLLNMLLDILSDELIDAAIDCILPADYLIDLLCKLQVVLVLSIFNFTC